MTKRLAIGPSMASFAQGSAVIAESSSNCPRYFLARKNGFKTDIDPLYTAMGEVDERRYMKQYQKANPQDTIETQINLDHELSPLSKIYGFLDMKITKVDGTIMLVEKKSHISKSTRLEVIRKKQVKLSHVAQLATYLMLTKLTSGKIVCDYYELNYDCDKLCNTEGIEFLVELRGRDIYVDGEKFKYDMNDLAKFYKIIDNAIKSDELPARPLPKTGGRTPCVYCPLSGKCDQADVEGLNKHGFLAKVLDDLDRLIETENNRRKKAEFFSPARKPKGEI